jgi:hypothetical protein
MLANLYYSNPSVYFIILYIKFSLFMLLRCFCLLIGPWLLYFCSYKQQFRVVKYLAQSQVTWDSVQGQHFNRGLHLKLMFFPVCTFHLPLQSKQVTHSQKLLQVQDNQMLFHKLVTYTHILNYSALKRLNWLIHSSNHSYCWNYSPFKIIL